MENVEPFETIFELIEMLIAKYGVLGIAAAMFAESAGVPFASTVVLLVSGTMILRGTVSFWSIFIASTVGITLGSIFSYILGLLGSVVGRQVRYNFLQRSYYDNDSVKARPGRINSKFMGLWDRYGNFSIFMGQLWGFTRTFISFPAGAMHMNFYLFIVYTFLGGSLFSLGAIGVSIALTGTMGITLKILRSLAGFSPWLLLIALTLLLGLGFYIYKKFTEKQKRKNGSLKQDKN